MDGIFMRKLFRQSLICLCIAGAVWTWTLVRDKQMLRERLIRFHVVANSDSESDQMVKYKVRDTILASIQDDLREIADVDQARKYLEDNLPKIQKIANETLTLCGFDESAVATLCKEAFDTTEYDSFTLPAGIYETLRIVIGEGEGQNWWCVSFPQLCLPVSSDTFEARTVGAGFSREVTGALAGNPRYQLRFYLLDAVGKFEIKFYPDK